VYAYSFSALWCCCGGVEKWQFRFRLKRDTTFKCEILLRLVDFAGATQRAAISKL
jgi:hypothetical protein